MGKILVGDGAPKTRRIVALPPPPVNTLMAASCLIMWGVGRGGYTANWGSVAK